MWQGEGIDGGGEGGVSLVNKIVKIARHSSLKSVHHNFHLFLYRLYLCNNRWWSHIREGQEAYILLLRSAWGVTTLRSFSVSSLSTGIFLVFFRNTVPSLPAQLFFQNLVLLGKAFNDRI